ncbi:MAG TPA: 30S ribosomal protein S4 [Candidatus Magasanikbacteria bacterium]|uniref:Small ribosomal subunit protein uS4 n=2 Tax=Candidatus Magasanikiibacteriota TaxID=1752731 RepID=A0A0G0WJG0_9BACT|nr:MAG: 30S ribosomal protein S4 [Candidatus Magasanikbacteria bacterium GW2011_GWC2_41_17]KKS13005.1 MAG: 30S ribosomal protein S4 [Candidatus Magasanikbacteria bacterium GW2011_GWA2_41_55]HBV58177.1 30S ribosomal protein S4 [Candidatus Magasanikbacteria bacterium]HBX15757.1 30S ribosomal protein S4 [Candidatus Magasanikbacteria bacterium]
MPKPDRVTIQCARCRRAGEKLFLKGDRCFGAKCALTRRSFAPGQHGPTQRIRLTSYGEQLKEKQKAKRVYGLRERQFSNYVAKASKRKGNTAEGFLKFLEKRLDNVVYRLGLAKSRESARQIVSHCHILVDNKRVNIPSFQVEPDQVVSIAEKSQSKKIFENLKQTLIKHEVPVWLSLNVETLTGKVLAEPKIEGMQFNFDPKKIIEFYSR